MKKFRMFLRGSVYWSQDKATGKQETLRTKDRSEALRLLHAKNEAQQQPIINLQIARAYLLVSDPAGATRTWQWVMDEIVKLKEGETRRRWIIATKDKALEGIRNLPLLETRAEHFLRALEKGKVSTNIYLRRIHNFAIAINWQPVPIIPTKQWPSFRFKEKRAITFNEHRVIVAGEMNPERRAFYELAWHMGASQSDIAFLDSDSVDWEARVISYARKKTGELAFVRFGDEVEALLKQLPKSGPLFPYLRTVRPSDRATEFKRRCKRVGVSGVTLHSYRYAWAERARKAGYRVRFNSAHAQSSERRSEPFGGRYPCDSRLDSSGTALKDRTGRSRYCWSARSLLTSRAWLFLCLTRGTGVLSVRTAVLLPDISYLRAGELSHSQSAAIFSQNVQESSLISQAKPQETAHRHGNYGLLALGMAADKRREHHE